MEVKEKSKKRELIKSIAIVFLTVLLLLTFFSNTIMNRSLPEVVTQSISSGTINAKIRGTGTVSANESYEVVIGQTRQVRSVCVQVGQHVQEGDLLFVLEDVESAELQAAQEQLQQLEMQYQQQLLTLSLQYATEDRSLEVLREDLDKLTKQRDENAVTDEEISYAKGDLAAAEAELKQIGLMLEELNAMLGDSDAYTQAKEAVSKWTGEQERAQQEITDYTKQLNDLNAGGSVDMTRQLQDALNALNAAKQQKASDEVVYKATYDEFALFVKSHYGEVVTDENVTQYMAAYITAGSNEANASFYDSYKLAFETLSADDQLIAQKQTAYDRLVEDQSAAQGDVNAQKQAIQAKLQQANYNYMIAAQQLQQANMALAQAQQENAALTEQIKMYEGNQRQQTAYVTDLTEALNDLQSKKTLYDQALEQIAAKERAIEDALTGKSIDKQIDDLNLQSIQNQIDKAKAQVEKFTAESVDTEIKANVSGLITAINVTAGKDCSAGVPMATIDIVDRGYTIKIPVTNQQSRQVRVGDTATVTNYYWGSDIEAKLEAVTSDPSNPGSGKLLVFRLTGEVEPGVNLTLSIGQRSANYDTIIPKSALRQDTNGYFVLVITVKSTPLSNRYMATRVDVQVLAEDDTSAAVSGLSAGDFVITTSSKPLEAGSQVRMVENP